MLAAGASKAMQHYETITGCGEVRRSPAATSENHGLRPTKPDSSVRLGEAHFDAAQEPADSSRQQPAKMA